MPGDQSRGLAIGATGLVKHVGRTRRDGLRGFHLRDGFAVRRPIPGFQRGRFGRAGIVHDFRFHIHRAGFLGDLRRGDKRAIPRHMQRRGDDQPHIAINAAGENMFARARRQPGVPKIVHAHGHDIVARLAASVMSKVKPV